MLVLQRLQVCHRLHALQLQTLIVMTCFWVWSVSQRGLKKRKQKCIRVTLIISSSWRRPARLRKHPTDLVLTEEQKKSRVIKNMLQRETDSKGHVIKTHERTCSHQKCFRVKREPDVYAVRPSHGSHVWAGTGPSPSFRWQSGCPCGQVEERRLELAYLWESCQMISQLSRLT